MQTLGKLMREVYPAEAADDAGDLRAVLLQSDVDAWLVMRSTPEHEVQAHDRLAGA